VFLHRSEAPLHLINDVRIPNGNEHRAFLVHTDQHHGAVGVFGDFVGEHGQLFRISIDDDALHERDGTRAPAPFYTRPVQQILVTGAKHAPALAGALGYRELDEGAGLDFARQLVDEQPSVVFHLGPKSEALLGALGRVDQLRHLIVRSDLAVYGTGPRMPSILTPTSAFQPASNSYERSLRRLEADVRAFAEERPSVSVTILRLAPILGDDGPLSDYLALPTIPSILGFDPRLQLLSLDDAAAALAGVIEQETEGTLDIAGSVPLYLSRIARLGGRRLRPLPEPIFRRLASLLELPDHLVDLLKYGRVVEPFNTAHTRDTVLDFYGTWKSSSIV
jgi:hypothetical protein